jgi:hypothetical protein
MLFFKRKKDQPRPVPPPASYYVELSGRDYDQLAECDTALKFWLPESVEKKIGEMCSFQNTTTTAIIRQILFIHLYGLNKSTVDISDDIKMGGIGFAVQYGMQKWKETRLKKSKELFICFDDIERWVGDVSVWLSYINKLVEHDSTKCLIIGNSIKIEDKIKFNNTKDKIIGFRYRLSHAPNKVFEAAFTLATLPNSKTEKLLKQIYKNNSARINACITERNVQI